MERQLRGVPASPGIVIGPVHLLRWEVPDIRHRIIRDEEVSAELQRFHTDVGRSKERLRHVRDRVEASAGKEEAAIFDVQLSILEDAELIEDVAELIRQNLAAEKAFDLVMLEWRQRFARHSHPMIRERVGDLLDVHIRVLSVLLGLPDHDPVDVPKGANAILVTHDLTPSLTVQLDREAIAAIATDAGTRTSHVAILARSLGLPAVVGLRTATIDLRGGERAILDGTLGLLAVSPSDEDIREYQLRAIHEAEEESELLALIGAEAVTRDAERVTLWANVDLPEEAEQAAASGAEGVGLMRTEFLVVGRAAMPDEDEQYRQYRRVVEAFHGLPVVIRTFDIGGDKLPIGGFPVEANPFLGWRAIRMCLDQPELFKTQLRAIARAGLRGDVRILLPLIVSVDEVLQTKELLASAYAELAERKVPHRSDLPIGAMIETPAAAMIADAIAAHVSFFSIGTNDMVQYALAVDRGNANLASRFTALHPAILKLIALTADAGRRRGIEVSVCGEMASHPLMAFALVGLGLRCLSVSPRSVSYIKRMIRNIDAESAREAVAEALLSSTAAECESILRRHLENAGGATQVAVDGLPAQ
jgi:phosphoenolpyruvate-protein phosphotransferase (PTS system enzyme I)